MLPDGSVIDEFDSAAFLEGAIVDESTDPPFTLGAGTSDAPAFSGPDALTGPTTASSQRLNHIIETDVFPETVAQFVIEQPLPPGLQTPDPTLPPAAGEYRTPAQVHATYTGPDLQIVLQDIRHRAFTNRVITATVTDEIEEFRFGTGRYGGRYFRLARFERRAVAG